jgi:hypothetical protein
MGDPPGRFGLDLLRRPARVLPAQVVQQHGSGTPEHLIGDPEALLTAHAAEVFGGPIIDHLDARHGRPGDPEIDRYSRLLRLAARHWSTCAHLYRPTAGYYMESA